MWISTIPRGFQYSPWNSTIPRGVLKASIFNYHKSSNISDCGTFAFANELCFHIAKETDCLTLANVSGCACVSLANGSGCACVSLANVSGCACVSLANVRGRRPSLSRADVVRSRGERWAPPTVTLRDGGGSLRSPLAFVHFVCVVLVDSGWTSSSQH